VKKKGPKVRARPTPLTLREYQRGVVRTDDSRKTLVSLLGLVGELGDIQTVFKRRLEQRGYPYFRRDLKEELGDTLWYLASLAHVHGLSLQEIAEENLAKARAFHTRGSITHFDRGFPPDEQFPRKFEVIFEEKPLGGGVQVKIRQNGVFIGDALTDNAHKDDGYRYHDAFHLSYAAILGWSPVVRTLLRRKRKSNAKTDEVEDGARAKIVEEAISIFVFNQSKSRNEYLEPGSIDISLLKIVKRLAGELEVKKCTGKQWREAIYQGYKVFRALRDNNGGVVSMDLDNATISHSPLRRPAKGKENAKRATPKLPRRVARRRPPSPNPPR
jgi:NTP pyrophosphatase (non-canonical NTP hydrolase)